VHVVGFITRISCETEGSGLRLAAWSGLLVDVSVCLKWMMSVYRRRLGENYKLSQKIYFKHWLNLIVAEPCLRSGIMLSVSSCSLFVDTSSKSASFYSVRIGESILLALLRFSGLISFFRELASPHWAKMRFPKGSLIKCK